MSVPGVDVTGGAVPGSDRILTDDALAFVADLQRRFKPLREDLLQRRHERDKAIRAGDAATRLPARDGGDPRRRLVGGAGAGRPG